MKKTITILPGIFFSTVIFSQNPQLQPVNPNGQKNIPANLKPVTKADLSITAISLISATGGNTEWDIKIAVTIRNTGGSAAPATKLKAMAQNSAAANPWKEMALLDVPSIKPGLSLTKEFRIYDKQWVMHKIPEFNFKLLADAANQADESAENNNESAVIRISAR